MGTRRNIVNELKTRLEASGRFELVSVWGKTVFTTQLPAVNIRYAAEADTVDGEGLSGPKNVWTRTLPVGITIAAKADATLEQVEELIGTVYSCIASDETFGGRAMAAYVRSDMLTKDEAEETINGAVIMLDILYRTNHYEQ